MAHEGVRFLLKTSFCTPHCLPGHAERGGFPRPLTGQFSAELMHKYSWLHWRWKRMIRNSNAAFYLGMSFRYEEVPVPRIQGTCTESTRFIHIALRLMEPILGCSVNSRFDENAESPPKKRGKKQSRDNKRHSISRCDDWLALGSALCPISKYDLGLDIIKDGRSPLREAGYCLQIQIELRTC